MTTEQTKAIAAAQEFWGRSWKVYLRAAWMTGCYPESLKPHVPHLQYLRNQGHQLK